MSNPAINGSNINEKKTEMAKSTQTIAMFYSRWDAMASGCHASWPRRSKFCRQRKSSDGLTLSSHSTFVSSVPRREVTNPKLLDRLISGSTMTWSMISILWVCFGCSSCYSWNLRPCGQFFDKGIFRLVDIFSQTNFKAVFYHFYTTFVLTVLFQAR